jgi:Fe-S cluster biogenesis protein NfuA
MGEKQGLQKRLHRISGLLSDLEQIADPKSRAAARELVQTLVDVHSAALERILEQVFQAGDVGQRVIDDLGADPLVAGLLVLYGLHPDPLEVRVAKALARIAPSLRNHGLEAQLVSLEHADLRLRLTSGGHACGSTTATGKIMLEDAIYESAPELNSLVIEGAEGRSASGFVPLGALAGTERKERSAHRDSLATISGD